MRRLIRTVSEFLEDGEWWLPALDLLLIASGVIMTAGSILGGGR
jgi:hypothetical protein